MSKFDKFKEVGLGEEGGDQKKYRASKREIKQGYEKKEEVEKPDSILQEIEDAIKDFPEDKELPKKIIKLQEEAEKLAKIAKETGKNKEQRRKQALDDLRNILEKIKRLIENALKNKGEGGMLAEEEISAVKEASEFSMPLPFMPEKKAEEEQQQAVEAKKEELTVEPINSVAPEENPEVITVEDFNGVLDEVEKDLMEEYKETLDKKINTGKFIGTLGYIIGILIREFKKNYKEEKKQYKEIEEKIKNNFINIGERWEKMEKEEKLGYLKECIKDEIKNIKIKKQILEETTLSAPIEKSPKEQKELLEKLWDKILEYYANKFPEKISDEIDLEYNMRFDILNRISKDQREGDGTTLSEEKIKEEIEEEVKRAKNVKQGDKFRVILEKSRKKINELIARMPGGRVIKFEYQPEGKEGDVVEVEITEIWESVYEAKIVLDEKKKEEKVGIEEKFNHLHLSELLNLLGEKGISSKEKKVIEQKLEEREKEEIKKERDEYEKLFAKYKEEYYPEYKKNYYQEYKEKYFEEDKEKYYQELLQDGKTKEDTKKEAEVKAEARIEARIKGKVSEEARWKAILEVVGQKVEKITYYFLRQEEIKALEKLKKENYAKFEEKFREMSRKTWQIAVHGYWGRDKKTLKTDLDVNTCLGLLREAGFGKNVDDVTLVPPGKFAPGCLNIDTSGNKGIGVGDIFAYIDDHSLTSSKESICAVRWLYLALLSKGFIEKDPILDKLTQFVSQCDRAEFPQIIGKAEDARIVLLDSKRDNDEKLTPTEEAELKSLKAEVKVGIYYFKNAHRTIAGLWHCPQLQFENLYQFFKDGKSPTEILTDDELKKYGLLKINEKDGKRTGASERQKDTNRISKEKLEELEKNSYIIETTKFSKDKKAQRIIVDIDRQIPGRYPAVRASGYDGFVRWNPKENGFLITINNADLSSLDIQGKRVKKSMWMKLTDDGEPLSVSLKEIIKALNGKIQEEGGLKKYIDKEDFGKVLDEIFIAYEKVLEGNELEDRRALFNDFFENFGKGEKGKEEFKKYEEEIKLELEKLKGAMSGEKWNLFKEQVKGIMEKILKERKTELTKEEKIKEATEKLREKIRKKLETKSGYLSSDEKTQEEMVKKWFQKILESHNLTFPNQQIKIK